MDAVDGSTHYEVSTTDETPSLLTIVLDTNPRAWAALYDTLALSKAVANLLVFVSSHLALTGANQVGLLAAHCNRAVWLYPSPPKLSKTTSEDVEMVDADRPAGAGRRSANKFPQFADVETTVLKSLRDLIAGTTEADLDATTTQISGALTLALAHINKAAISLPTTKNPSPFATKDVTKPTSDDPVGLHARILVLSVSDSSPAQYIPTMNAVFAASHARVAIDVLSLHGTAPFLQQAAHITGGTFLSCASNPRALLSYLTLGFASASAFSDSRALRPTNTDVVDFRAACFCHRNVVDTGFVCSICLSIFCEVPPGAECLTCGTKLMLGNYGSKPFVAYNPLEKVKKKKRKKVVNGEVREGTGTPAGTPRPS